ncbi:uncharacterized protein BCR38DRAFT_503520 [Pseudomassariella vexata]|uniref:Integral membrane protein n=1 Tax=Pseudomassariella vexata TaxID=1141098 RepID=A0A1Y2EG00_9PEZI|nr:uncharacterized protein BCR38DRAFT_503520 [Pseudomassariella vexata]ORY70234.1 hypothetical protein BCR38DRAFT_503520 [Pseudomassariella vexata]
MDESHDSLAAVIEASATIKKPAFKITVGVCFGLALLSVVARAVIRLRTRRQLSLDDYLIFLAAAFLSAATGLMYHLCDEFYLSTAIQKDMSIVFRLDLQQFNAIVINAVQENATFLIIAWTTTFFVKFSFLAFFKGLIRLVDRIKYYYWTVVVFTVVSWMFLVSEPFILCSDFGYASCTLRHLTFAVCMCLN